jgi:hypothetical protein
VPRLIDAPTQDSCTLGDLVERLETGGFDARDEDGFAAWGSELKKLANNRTFLADLMIAELKQRCRGQVRENQYSAQVVMLHASAQRYIIRANFWPATKDSVVRHSGTDPFFYHVPHDHNFSFLTVGYLGPGYWSDYYEYDYETVVGVPDEAVDLKFVERSKLDPGKVMLYRAHRDVHNQLPADEMSVSLNILETAHAATFRDQYRFDVETRRIDGIMTRTSLEPLLALAAHYGGDEGTDLLVEFARNHPSDRVRWSALHARAGAAPTVDARVDLFAQAADGGSLLMAGMAKRELARLEAGRAWIDGAPLAQIEPAA